MEQERQLEKQTTILPTHFSPITSEYLYERGFEQFSPTITEFGVDPVGLYTKEIFTSSGRHLVMVKYDGPGKAKVEISDGFWGGFFGMADHINLKIQSIAQLEAVMNLIVLM